MVTLVVTVVTTPEGDCKHVVEPVGKSKRVTSKGPSIYYQEIAGYRVLSGSVKSLI